MTRAEEKALIVYPVVSLTNDTNAPKRKYFTDGYALAEQDLKEKFKMWVAYNGYTAEDAEAVYNDFEQFIAKN